MNTMKQSRYSLSVVTLLVGFLFAGGLGFTALIPISAASTTLNNVQVFVQTTNSNMNSYSLTAYNSSGYEVTSATNSYAGFGLELPSGTYLITVTATQSGSYYPIVYSTGVATPVNSSSAVVSPPVKEPVTEYGYALQTISGPATLNIKTAPFDNVPTTKVHVSVSYFNGTGAAGVWVYGSVVGGYYYDGLNTKAVMENQTSAGGSTTLIVPNLPILIQGYISIPITVPKTTTATTTTVGGQPVNITMYWEPNYVELSGTALIIPPQTSAQMTLKVEQSNYIVEPYTTGGVSSGAAAASTVSNGAGQTGNNSTTTPTQIPPFESHLGGVTLQSSSSTGPAKVNTITIALVAVVIALAAVAGFAAFRLRKPS